MRLNNILSSLGIGASRIDAVLDDPVAVPGGQLDGQIEIEGGDVDQQVRGIDLELVTRARVEVNDDKRIADIPLGQVRIEADDIRAGNRTSIPFSIAVPYSAPLSVGSTTTFLRSRIDIPRAVDPKDTDTVEIRPDPEMEAVFAAMKGLGFSIKEVEVEYTRRRDPPIMQEFDFRPSRGWRIEEVELAFLPSKSDVSVLVTVDRRGGLFSLGGERRQKFVLPRGRAARFDLQTELRGLIESLS